jgi:sec-independent protein translocase protein TatA
MFEDKWIFVILIIALLFGASRLPMLGRNFGRGIKEFKQGLADAQRDGRDDGKGEAKADAAKEQSEAARPASGSADDNGAGA